MSKEFEFLLSHAHYLVKQMKHILRNAKKINFFLVALRQVFHLPGLNLVIFI